MRQVDFVVVSGPPGSGKSTLAAGLASQLGLPLLGKDIIKEALMDSLGASTIDESRRVGGASISVLFALATATSNGGSSDPRTRQRLSATHRRWSVWVGGSVGAIARGYEMSAQATRSCRSAWPGVRSYLRGRVG